MAGSPNYLKLILFVLHPFETLCESKALDENTHY